MSDLGWEERPRPGMTSEAVIGRALMARAVAHEARVAPGVAWEAVNAEIVGIGFVTGASVNAIMDAAVEGLRAGEPYEGWDGLNPPDYEPPVTAGRRYILTRGGTFVDSVCVKTDGYMPGVAEFEHNIRIDLTGWVIKDRGPA